MSLAKDNIWKLLAPLVVMGVMFLIPVPGGMPPQAWHYFAAVSYTHLKIGCIVMNANPFTNGHRYLIQQAAAQCDWLHLFLVDVYKRQVNDRGIRLPAVVLI